MRTFFKLLAVVLSLACLPARATTITASIEFTNRTTGLSNFITVKSNTRKFTNDVSSSTSTLIVTNSATGSATNFYLHAGLNAYGGGIFVRMASTNKVQIIGDETLTASIGAGFAILTLDTNAGGTRYQWYGPYTALQSTNAAQQASEVVRGFDYATNTVPTNSPAFTTYLNTGPGPQTAANKTLTNATLLGPAIANAMATNGWSTNAALLRAKQTNGSLVGIFEMPEAGSAIFSNTFYGSSFVFDVAGPLSTNHVIRYFEFAQLKTTMNTNQFILDTENNAWDLRTNAPIWSPVLPDGATNYGALEIADGGVLQFDEFSGILSPIDEITYTFNDAATDYGESSIVALRAFNKTQFAYQPGAQSNSLSLISGVRATNAALWGVTNMGVVQHTATNITTLANGNNTVDPGLKRTVVISGNTTAATLISMLGGADGREVLIVKTSGASLIIANDSGLDGTVANRFYTGTGADVTYTNVPVVVPVVWVSALSRWVIERDQ